MPSPKKSHVERLQQLVRSCRELSNGFVRNSEEEVFARAERLCSSLWIAQSEHNLLCYETKKCRHTHAFRVRMDVACILVNVAIFKMTDTTLDMVELMDLAKRCGVKEPLRTRKAMRRRRVNIFTLLASNRFPCARNLDPHERLHILSTNPVMIEEVCRCNHAK